jgi:hypothetical protein
MPTRPGCYPLAASPPNRFGPFNFGGASNVATFCPWPGCCDADRRNHRGGTIRVCRFSVRTILPAGLWLPAAELPSALRGGNTRAPSGCGKRRRWGRPYRGDFGECRTGCCNRGRIRRSPQCSTPGFGAQCGCMLLRDDRLPTEIGASAFRVAASSTSSLSKPIKAK